MDFPENELNNQKWIFLKMSIKVEFHQNSQLFFPLRLSVFGVYISSNTESLDGKVVANAAVLFVCL